MIVMVCILSQRYDFVKFIAFLFCLYCKNGVIVLEFVRGLG
jgi:hypothetical protein